VTSSGLAHRLRLMVLTDPAAPLGPVEAARQALEAGATSIQLRAKDAPSRALLDLARTLRESTRRVGALLIVNDRIDVALAAVADGAHLGADDLPLEVARALVPPGFLLGRSVDDASEARAAAIAGADYIGIGPFAATPSKRDTGPVIGAEGVRAARAAVDLPIVAIGGVHAGNAHDAIAAGADGIAVIGAITLSADPGEATRALLRAITETPASR